MSPWPWSRPDDRRTPETREATLRFTFARPVDAAALRRATRVGLKAATRALPGKGRVRATADLRDGVEALIALTLTGERVDDAATAPVKEAFARAFRASYRGIFAQREVPARVPDAPGGDGAAPAGDVSAQ